MVLCRGSSKGPSATVTCQNSALQSLITKHMGSSEELANFQNGGDFAITSTERDLHRWEHAHLVAALDVLNSYQRERKARASLGMGGKFVRWSKQYNKDPRTRIIELLKRWLRTHAVAASIGEEEVRSVSSLCRDLLNYPHIFPARNPRSFLQTIAEVYDHMQLQLREVLEKDRTCAELAQRAISLSKNLISDALAYLMLAATDLSQTDALPSLEVVALWQSLPPFEHPLPGRVDAKLQKGMKEAWRSRCGIMIATILRAPHVVRLFDGIIGEEEMAAAEQKLALTTDQARSPVGGHSPPPKTPRLMTPRTPVQSGAPPDDDLPQTVPAMVAFIEEEFECGHYRGSGLAGYLRNAQNREARRRYLEAIVLVYDLTYLLGEVFVHFHRISDGLGDYGTIRVAPWLHPFIEALSDKVLQLKVSLEHLSGYIDDVLVLARARKASVEKPCPSARMSARAHAAVQRAVIGRDSHAPLLLQTMEELKSRSAPERLPFVMEGLGDACMQLQRALGSPEFRARVGDAFPELPPIIPSIEPEAKVSQAVAALEDGPEQAAHRELQLVYQQPGEPNQVMQRPWEHQQQQQQPWERQQQFQLAQQQPQQQPQLAQRTMVPSPQKAPSPSTSFSSTATGSTHAPSETALMPAFVDASPRFLGSRRLAAALASEDGSPPMARLRRFGSRSPSPMRAIAGTGAVVRSHSQPEHVRPPQFGYSEEQGTPRRAQVQTGPPRPQSAPRRAQLPPPPPASLPEAVRAAGGGTEVRAEVNRLERKGTGEFRVHDKRSLAVSRNRIYIYEKGSVSDVKRLVNIQQEVTNCGLLDGGIMLLCLRAKAPTAYHAEKSIDAKEYYFQFMSDWKAAEFYKQVQNALAAPPSPARHMPSAVVGQGGQRAFAPNSDAMQVSRGTAHSRSASRPRASSENSQDGAHALPPRPPASRSRAMTVD